MDKTYMVRFCFGTSTDSGDRDGIILENWTESQINEYYNQNILRIQEEIQNLKHQTYQIPPKISALKVNGKRQAELFRKGIEFKTQKRPIQVHSFSYSNLSCTGFDITVKVSSGTYIRKFAIDLAEKLSFPIFVESLKRTEIGSARIENSLSYDSILNGIWELHGIEDMYPFEKCIISPKDEKIILNGGYIDLPKIYTTDFLIKSESNQILAWCNPKKTDNKPYTYLKVFNDFSDKTSIKK